MPPKGQGRGRRSQQTTPELIPIYDILIDREKQNAVRELVKKIDTQTKHNLSSVERSFFVFILKICGLDGCVDKINWGQAIQSVSDLIEEICEQNQKSVVVNELFLINLKSKFHSQFMLRIKQLLEVVISDQLNLLSESQLMKNMYELLLIISKCKLRNIRNCSIALCSLIITRTKDFYIELSNHGNNRRASKLLTIIDQGYLNHIVKPRFKDIDILIRQKSFLIVFQTIRELNKQLLTLNRLNQYFTQTLSQNKSKITQLCLKTLIKLFQIDKQKLGSTSTRNLQAYGIQIIKVLQELVLLPNRNSCLAMQVLLSIYNFNPKLDALKPKIIAKIFQVHGYQKFQQGLKKAVLIFFKSLVPFSSKEQLNQHRPLLLIEITHLLCSINSSKLLQTILYQFFVNYSSLFSFDEMFLLLLTQYYHRDGSDVELQQKELLVICTMICQFNVYVRKDMGKSQLKEKEEALYNKNVLTNCKQIYYQKIGKHPSIAHIYLRLFSQLFMPVSGALSSYLDFILDKTLDFIKQEKYISMSADNLVLIQQIIHQCVAIWKRISSNGSSLRALLKSFNVLQALDKERLTDLQIIKVAALVSHIEVDELLNQKVMKKVTNSYNRLQQKVIKLECLTFAYHCHRHMFIVLFNNPSQPLHRQYIDVRNALMQFIFQVILDSSSEQTIVKLGAFNTLTKTLCLVSNSKISDLPVVYFDPDNQQMETLFNFIGQYIKFQEEHSVGELSIMMSNVSLQNQQIKQQILQNIFNVFSQCYRLALHKQSIQFIIKCINPNMLYLNKYLQSFLFQLIKAQISNENNNRFIFWRVFGEVMLHITSQEGQKADYILMKFLDVYYKYRKGQNQTKSLLNNKLMLYVADFIDKCISNSRYGDLNLIEKLLTKNYRRFPKQTLQRLYIFFTSKIEGKEDQKIKEIKDFLNKIGKVGKKTNKSKASKDDNDLQSSIQSQKEQKNPNQQDEQDQQEDEQHRRGSNLKKQQKNNMEKKDDQSRRTRSRTKIKNK